MIVLTKLNAEPLALDPDLIGHVEGGPQTVITMVDGTELMVKEDLREVIERSRHHCAAFLSETRRFRASAARPQGEGELLVLVPKPRNRR